MSINESLLKYSEKSVFKLRNLYNKYGYMHYKVNKFEEYDLYMKNKNFLVNDNILTFTDTNGKLMALKPDITLSIIKNTNDSDKSLQKVYYDENVYRPVDSNGFKEITQTGLECIGDIDMYSVCEVIMLAIKSLAAISETYLLDISHIGFTSGILDETNADEDVKNQLVFAMGKKSRSIITKICKDNNINSEICDALCKVSTIYGPLDKELEELKELILNTKMQEAYNELKQIYKVLNDYGVVENVRADFSVVNDMNYYNGIVFQGFVEKIPTSILSGGRYDNLVHKMGKKKGALGFAVYLDLLERIEETDKKYDIDILLIYNENSETNDIIKAVQKLSADGSSVKASKYEDDNINYRKKAVLNGSEVSIVE